MLVITIVIEKINEVSETLDTVAGMEVSIN